MCKGAGGSTRSLRSIRCHTDHILYPWVARSYHTGIIRLNPHVIVVDCCGLLMLLLWTRIVYQVRSKSLLNICWWVCAEHEFNSISSSSVLARSLYNSRRWQTMAMPRPYLPSFVWRSGLSPHVLCALHSGCAIIVPVWLSGSTCIHVQMTSKHSKVPPPIVSNLTQGKYY